MANFFERLIDILLQMSDAFLYIFLFISAIVENLFPPIPGDTITAFGAFLVGIGRLNYFWVFFSTTTGSVIGFMSLFLFVRHIGKKFLQKKNYKVFSIKKIEKTEIWIHKYGYWIILANRFLPTIRSVISVASGISKLHVIRVLILSLISASVWNLIWIHTGYLLGANWDIVKDKFTKIMMNYNITAWIIIILSVIIFIVWEYKRKRKKSSPDAP
ncbi:MAG: DedA family protein [Spirochaetota bacterium]